MQNEIITETKNYKNTIVIQRTFIRLGRCLAQIDLLKEDTDASDIGRRHLTGRIRVTWSWCTPTAGWSKTCTRTFDTPAQAHQFAENKLVALKGWLQEQLTVGP